MEAQTTRVTFRPLRRHDLPAMAHWLADPDVARWYGEGEPSVSNLETKYGPRIDGAEPTHGFIIVIDGHDAGYIQSYLIADYPDYAQHLEVATGAAGVDLFLGDPAYRDRGWGAPVLRAFLRQIIFGRLNAISCVIGPVPENGRAIQAYAKAGFRYLKTVHVTADDEDEDEYLMMITPDELSQSKVVANSIP